MSRRDDKNLYLRTGGDFIDPESVGSFVRYRFVVGANQDVAPDERYVNHDCTITLGDCNRVISWDLSSDGRDALEKLDRVIKIFKRARQDFVDAQKIYDAEYKIVKAARAAKKAAKVVDVREV